MNVATLEGVFTPPQQPPVMGGGQGLPVSPPEGYGVVITESEMRPTQSGTGTMLSLTCKVLDGPSAGVEGIWNLNLGNPNPTTVRIAMEELGAICHAVGHLAPLTTTEPIHNKPFRIVVVAQKNKDGSINENGYTGVKKVLRADGSKLTDPPSGAAPSAAPAPAPAPAPVAPAAPAPVAPVATAQPAPDPAPGWPAQPETAAPPAAVAPALPPTPVAPAPAPAPVAPGGQPWNAAPQ